MGKYITLIQNLAIDDFNFTETFGNDTITPAINSSNQSTNGFLGIAVLIPIWFGLYQHLSNRENLFDLTKLQALTSINAMIFTLALGLVHVQILTVPQHFVWVTFIVFIVNVIGILRTA